MLLLLEVVVVLSSTPDLLRAAEPRIDFIRDVRPILSDKCFSCHGPDSSSREADLRLDRELDAFADRGDGTFTIVPGDLSRSQLIYRVTSQDPDERMPPPYSGKLLKAEEIEILKRWIAEGAVWSLPWAYVAPRRHSPPEVANPSWPVNWIDHFVLARLESEGISPSPDADPITLIRRASIDLTGLPPTPEQVEQFLADERPDAYERLIDRLLASPHFGERMAIYWLDLVRYADTVGCHGDQDHNISPYRDYVIGAFNANLPFDRFTQEQLAGDLLSSPTTEQKIATGYNRVLPTNHEDGVQLKEWLAIYAADRVRNVSAVWMGATLGCAQCHDHKYDPYTQRDFYSLSAFFADIDETSHLVRTEPRPINALPTSRAPELELLSPSERERFAWLKSRVKELEHRLHKEGSDRQVSQTTRRSSLLVGADEEDLSNSTKTSEILEELTECREELDKFDRVAHRTMITVAVEPRVVRILPRGDWMDESGPIVQPTVPAFLGKLHTGGRRATRLDLAKWLTDARNGVGGLTARVMVNRFWYLLHGEGLARTLDDFGGQGEAPTHPELLDRLAVEFVESGWDVKHLMKLIATSRTYRQSSKPRTDLLDRDPLNRLLARQARFRFPAEVVRDSALAISNLLDRTVGGPSVKPYQPVGYYRHLNMPQREYQHHRDERQWRRGVYMHWQRQYVHPMLKAFDAPSREECTAQRPRSNTALAALVLLNDPTFTEAARVLAQRAIQEGGDSAEERIDFAYRQALSRRATRSERDRLLQLLRKSEIHYGSAFDDASSLTAIGLKPIDDEIDPVELASWTVVARAVLNTYEAITRK